jgi:glycosyltransferase involved in cell wall biosynthesis
MIVLLDLPEPVHGMSTINEKMARRLSNRSVIINSCPSYASRFFNYRIWGVLKIIHFFFTYIKVIFFLLNMHRHIVFYRSIYGGYGQVFDVFYLALARFFRSRIYIHHHSFQYLNKKSILFSFVNWVSGDKAVHIVLGSSMSSRLSNLYSVPRNNIRILSNSSFYNGLPLDIPTGSTEISNIVIAHMSNLCLEKGISRYADVCYELHSMGLDFTPLLAGPIMNSDTQDIVDTMKAKLPGLVYVGPVYGEDKVDFFKRADAFVFMSEYVNEAEPLVLYEAAANGAKIYCSQVGCMEDVSEQLKGTSFSKGCTAREVAEVVADDYYSGLLIQGKNERLKVYSEVVSLNEIALKSLIKEMENEFPKFE